MRAEQFRTWRRAHFSSADDAAYALGLTHATVRLYERGKRWDRDEKAVVIPKTVELACYAIDQLGAAGAVRFRYPAPAEGRVKVRRRPVREPKAEAAP